MQKIGRRFGRHKFSAYPAIAAKNKGWTAGIDLGDALFIRRFTRNPRALLNGDRPTRTALEVYPHTIHVRLFDLSERIRYKKGRVADKKAGLLEYQWRLERLIEDVAPNVLQCNDVLRVLHPETATAAKGASLKRLDDTLDGLTCAVAAFLIWSEPQKWEMIGDLKGYIVAPREGYWG